MTDHLYNDAASWLRHEGYVVDRVIRIEQDLEQVQGCGEGTCTWDIIVVRIHFLDDEGREDYEDFEGTMPEFLTAMLNNDAR